MSFAGKTITGIFMPKDETQFHPRALACKGKSGEWRFLRQVAKGEFENDQHIGKWIVQPMQGGFPFQWTLEEDIEVQ